MSRPRPTTPDTNLGTLDSSLAENLSGIQTPKDSRHPLNKFQDDVAVALVEGPSPEDDLPLIETERAVIEFYNKGAMKQFDEAGYFIFRDCRVCEIGNSQKVRDGLSMTHEEKLHGKK